MSSAATPAALSWSVTIVCSPGDTVPESSEKLSKSKRSPVFPILSTDLRRGGASEADASAHVRARTRVSIGQGGGGGRGSV